MEPWKTRLEALRLGSASVIVETFPGRYDDEASFNLYLAEEGKISSHPVFSGLLNLGRPSAGTKGFLDGCYLPRVQLGGRTFDLQEGKLDGPLFEALGGLIQPGGSFMVAYEMFSGEGKVHQETWRALSLGIPPAATPLGFLLFQAGCRGFRNWDIAEGGREGFRKLQGFKPLDPRHRTALERTLERELLGFLSGRGLEGYEDVYTPCEERASIILQTLGCPPGSGPDADQSPTRRTIPSPA